MPTGYTSEIYDNKQIAFEEFVLKCARAMGACIMQRDDNMEVLPVTQEPYIKHYIDNLKELNVEKQSILNLDDRKIIARHTQEIIDSITENKKCKQENFALAKSYGSMLGQVHAWSPPSEEHKGLKNFMIEQLNESIKFDCGTEFCDQIISEKTKLLNDKFDAKVIRKQLIDDLDKKIQFNEQQMEEEIKRAVERNNWIKQLYKSLDMEI